MSFKVGELISERYELRSELGRGGFGQIFRALDVSLKREVALKVLHKELNNDTSVLDRFMREAQVAASLKHPHSLRIFDYGQGGEGELYIVSELLEGETLASKIAREGALDPGWLIEQLAPVCLALEEAHAAQVIHRDLKPENLFIHRGSLEERVVVIDFGISKLLTPSSAELTQTGELFGTPRYISP